MEQKPSARHKAKNKKAPPNAKPKAAKKRKSEGPTCSMFLAELTRKLINKKKMEEEAPKNIVQTIVDSIANALPIKFSKKSPPTTPSPMKMETLQTFAPELLPVDMVEIPQASPNVPEEVKITTVTETATTSEVPHPPPAPFKMPKMPITDSVVIRKAIEKRKKEPMQDEAINTGPDVATEIAKHVNTLRKISLIAEEFNQKTAKNLKEIVDSVQDDLIKKLEEIEGPQKPTEKVEEVQPPPQTQPQPVEE